MKIFNIPVKVKEGQCYAMRCTDDNLKEAEYIDGRIIQICEKHFKQLEEYKKGNTSVKIQTNEEEKIKTYLTTNNPEEADKLKEEIGPLVKGDLPARTLESVLTENLAVKNDVIQSRQEAAKKIYQIAMAIEVVDITTRDKLDQVLKFVHEEEKAVKKEIDEMYKPVKDAAKATRNRLNSWFGEILTFYSDSKTIMKDKLGEFRQKEKQREKDALEAGDNETAAQCVTEPSKNVAIRKTFEYAIQNKGVNLPLELLIPDPEKNTEIVKLLPREMLMPNYDLIDTLVKEHGRRVAIPDVMIIEHEKEQMKGGRSS